MHGFCYEESATYVAQRAPVEQHAIGDDGEAAGDVHAVSEYLRRAVEDCKPTMHDVYATGHIHRAGHCGAVANDDEARVDEVEPTGDNRAVGLHVQLQRRSSRT